MFKAVLSCIRRVVGSYSGGFGTASSVIGAALEWLGRSTSLPGWAFLVFGAVLLFVTACRIEWELITEKEKNHKAEPNMTLERVIERMRGTTDILGPQDSEIMEVLRAFKSLEEKGATAALTIFGVKGIRHLDSEEKGDPEAYLKRLPIPPDFWNTNRIDGIEFISDRSGVTKSTVDPHERYGEGYGYLWFDSRQIDSYWPPRRKFRLRNPFFNVTEGA